MDRSTTGTRMLVAAVIAGLALVEPVTHFWILYFPPAGTVPTGVHTGDSAHHLVCMRAFHTGFFSPFATCQSELGPRDVHYFCTPFFLCYALFGEVGRMLRFNAFVFLGVLNGLGLALYLAMAWRFLRTALPERALPAFVLFTLGGGLGGVLYCAARYTGWHASPGFEREFLRFAWYELIEGQHLSPLLLAPRFYYTFPLGLGLGALAAQIRAERDGSFKAALYGSLLMLGAAFLNPRLGPMLWLVAALYLAAGARSGVWRRLAVAAAFGAPVALGVTGAWAVLRLHPAYLENVARVTQDMMRLMPFLTATVLMWLAAAPGTLFAFRELPRPLRCAAWALAAYLAVYTVLYLGYQAYYGNWLYGGAVNAAVAVSDPALAGAVAGLFFAVLLERRPAAEARPLGWVALWLLLFLAVAVSAWGRGWALRLSPQRLMVLLGLPLAMLAAHGLGHMPRIARYPLYALILGCGLVSLVVSALFFQGVAHRRAGEGPFAYLNYALMTPADAVLLNKLPEGTVAAPPWSPIAFGEVAAQRPGISVVGGPGALNLGSQPFDRVQGAVNAFFEPATPAAQRREFVADWCVDYVLCPDTCPCPVEVVAAFDEITWLKEIARAGRGRLYMVTIE